MFMILNWLFLWLSQANGLGVKTCAQYCRAEAKCQSISFNMATLSCSLFNDNFNFSKKGEEFYFEIKASRNISTSPRTVCLQTKTKGHQCIQCNERKPASLIVLSRSGWYHYKEQTGLWSNMSDPRPEHIVIDDNLKRIFWVITRDIQCIEVAALSNMKESRVLYRIDAKSKATLGPINRMARDPVRKLLFFTINNARVKSVKIYKIDETNEETVHLVDHQFQTEDLLIDPRKRCLYTYLLHKPGFVSKISYNGTIQEEISVQTSFKTLPSLVDNTGDVLLTVFWIPKGVPLLKQYNFSEHNTNSLQLSRGVPNMSIFGMTDDVFFIFGKGGGYIFNWKYKQVALIPDWPSNEMPTEIGAYTTNTI